MDMVEMAHKILRIPPPSGSAKGRPAGFEPANAGSSPAPETKENCCFVGCGKPAEFQILTVRDGTREAAPDPYTNDTYSCEAHTGALIGYHPDCENPGKLHWEIWPYPEKDGR